MTNWNLVTVAAASLPLITVVVAPRKWLKRSMMITLVSPVILYVAIIIWEVLTRPPEANALSLAVSGFMIISAVLTIPWLLICLVCFGLGFGIRRMLRGRESAVPTGRSTFDPTDRSAQ